MVLVLPQDAAGLAAVEKQLTTAKLRAWLGKLEAREIDVALPKFRIATSYRMNEPLEALGIRQAFVQVTEKGTEAAAATFVGGIFGGRPPSIPPSVPTGRSCSRSAT